MTDCVNTLHTDVVNCVTNCCDGEPTPPRENCGSTMVYCENKQLPEGGSEIVDPGAGLVEISNVTHKIDVKVGDCVVIDFSGFFSAVGEGIGKVFFQLFANGNAVSQEYEMDFVTANIDENATLHAVWRPTQDLIGVDVAAFWASQVTPIHMSRADFEGCMMRVQVFRDLGSCLDDWIKTKKFKGVAAVCSVVCDDDPKGPASNG
jgi:hypothetical protein